MSVINLMHGLPRLMTKILYGSGLRLMECMRLRVKDIDFDNHQTPALHPQRGASVIVRGGKGDDDRFTILPDSVAADIKHILQDVKALHDKDLRDGYGETILPNALGVKYKNAGKPWGWQFIFPASQRSMDRTSGVIRRRHLDESVLHTCPGGRCQGKAIQNAAQLAKIDKPIG
jgi:integrase